MLRVLMILFHLCALSTSIYGAILTIVLKFPILAICFCELWFIFTILASIFGLIYIGFLYYESEENQESSRKFLQYHYLFSWFTVVVGYPSSVTQAWIVYYPTHFAFIHIALAAIPMIAWIQRRNVLIVKTTEVVSAICIVSHAYICFLAKNHWGLSSAVLMAIVIILLSLPTRYSLFGITSREGFIISLAIVSFLQSNSIMQMGKGVEKVKDLYPKFN